MFKCSAIVFKQNGTKVETRENWVFIVEKYNKCVKIQTTLTDITCVSFLEQMFVLGVFRCKKRTRLQVITLFHKDTDIAAGEFFEFVSVVAMV